MIDSKLSLVGLIWLSIYQDVHGLQSIKTTAYLTKSNTLKAVLNTNANSDVNSASTASFEVDVAVLGSGIAGSTISWLLQEQEQCKVALIDKNVNKAAQWYPNYGEWQEEWHCLSERMKLPEMLACTTNEWQDTECFFGGSFDMPTKQMTALNRAYIRVDRIKMQELLRTKFKKTGGVTIPSNLSAIQISPNIYNKGIIHDASGSLLSLDDGTTVRTKLIIDATGLESRITRRETSNVARGSNKPLDTGYQIAYGFTTVVDSTGPYNFDAMTLFDYRTDHFDDDVHWKRDAENRPTFMYAMPLKKNDDGTFVVFWEETSLVGRGKRMLSFDECKKRAYRRLAHHNINILAVEDEEYCYIPMGGELPDLTQRTVGFGGAANMVHPSTGYQANRMFAASTDLAAVVGEGIRNKIMPDEISSNCYKALWNSQNRNQRDFQVSNLIYMIIT